MSECMFGLCRPGLMRVLPELARLALITASAEGVVSHGRLREISTELPADISKLLAGLVRDGYLSAKGAGRGMAYSLPWQQHGSSSMFDLAVSESLPATTSTIPPELTTIPPELTTIPPELNRKFADWSEVPDDLREFLLNLAYPVSQQRRVKPEILRKTILLLCKERYLGKRVLAHLLNRNPDDLFKRTLTPMLNSGQIKAAFTSSQDPRQAYIATSTNQTES